MWDKRKEYKIINSEKRKMDFFRVRVDSDLFKLFKKVIKKNKTTQQKFLDNAIRNYLIENLFNFIDDEKRSDE